MIETPVDEYDRALADRRAKAERWVNRLCVAFLATLSILVVFVLNWKTFRTSPHASAIWDGIFVVAAVSGVLAAGAAAAALKSWGALRPRHRVVALMLWPAYVVYVVVLWMMLR